MPAISYDLGEEACLIPLLYLLPNMPVLWEPACLLLTICRDGILGEDGKCVYYLCD